MDYTLLGGSGLKVSSLCFGLGTFGGGTEFLGRRARPAFAAIVQKEIVISKYHNEPHSINSVDGPDIAMLFQLVDYFLRSCCVNRIVWSNQLTT